MNVQAAWRVEQYNYERVYAQERLQAQRDPYFIRVKKFLVEFYDLFDDKQG